MDAEAGVDLSRYRNPLGWRNKLARAVWGTVWLLLFRPSPRPLHGWRRFLLRCFGARIGAHVSVYPGAVVWAPWNLEVLDYSWIADGVDCYCVAKVSIGPHAVVSQRAVLCTATHDTADPCFALRSAPIVVGAGAWIAAEAFVGPGVTVGAGAVAGARACVFEAVAPWTIVAGNPARVIKQRTLRVDASPPAAG